MSSPTSEPVVTAAEMRAAEAASGVPAWELMRRAGEGAARAIAAFDGPLPALVVCGPGNNGGDGYVVAATLRAMGWPVRVAALAPPATDCARQAAALWGRATETLAAEPAPLLIDALFGTGLSRPLDGDVVSDLHRLADAARLRVALDLPSGTATDAGEPLSPLPACDLTVTFGALKPAHLLFPAAASMGRTVVIDIGTRHDTTLSAFGDGVLPPIEGGAHKFERGHVAVISGPLGSTGASRMAAMGAARIAGYVTLLSSGGALAANAAHLTSTVLKRVDIAQEISEALVKADAVVIGPGLGERRETVLTVLAAGKPTVLDADVFTLFADDPDALFGAIRAPAVLTPHAGEFARLFGAGTGSKIDRARAAARRAGAVLLFKGPDSVVAAPDGRAAIHSRAAPELATAGSGDVLAGVIAALLARGMEAFEAAKLGVALHGRAGRRAGAGVTAEELPRFLA